MVALSPSPSPSSPTTTPVDQQPLNAVEQRALEHQKRHEWRQARYKSLEADSAAAEEVMLQVQQINSVRFEITSF
ncbi:unnamed protein product [Anisakis simplex]|uniref:Uncharacterized protein n=1 Tax=Anisakis simplex TaxID=6269 RepID=A0A3P6NIE8_ANISI|nr:unnamed protein product [Anisakis simplex]